MGRVYDDGERFKHPQDQCKSCTCYVSHTQLFQTYLHLITSNIKLESFIWIKIFYDWKVQNFKILVIKKKSFLIFLDFIEKLYITQSFEVFVILTFCTPLYFLQGDKVECVRQPCVTPCTYPTQGACCPLCDNCEFEGKIRQNGATFKPDACRTCTCTVSFKPRNVK